MWEDVAFSAKANLPRVLLLVDLQMRIIQRQQEMMIQAPADFARDLFEDRKIKNKLILAQCALQLYQHSVIMPVQALALAAKSNKMRRTEAQIATLNLDFAQNRWVFHDSPSLFSALLLWL